MVPDEKRVAPAWRRFLPVGILLAAMAVGYALGLHRYLSFAAFLESRAALAARVEAMPVVSALSFVAVYTVVVALSVPGASLLTLSAGFLFGWLAGSALTVIAATAGAVILFLVARSALADTFRRRAGPFLAKMQDGFQEDAFNYLLFLRLVPLFPFWLVNLAPALLGMRLGPYALATLIGILPGSIAFATIGAGLDSVIAASLAADPACAGGGACTPSLDPRKLVTPELLFGLGALGVVALIPVALKAWKRRKAEKPG